MSENLEDKFIMEIKTNLPIAPAKKDDINNLLSEKVKQTNDEKVAINLLATRSALENEYNIAKIVNEKSEELRNDAEAKRVKSETDRINEEVKRVTAEKLKQIEEYDKEITAKKKEVERLEAESNKESAYFESNKDILKYIGVTTKKTMKTMHVLMWPATLVFCIVQILLFPITFCGITLECLVNIVGGICGAIKNNALKIVISISIILLILVVVFFAYFYGGKFIAKI